MLPLPPSCRFVVPLIVLLLGAIPALADESGWIQLIGEEGLDAWKGPTDKWARGGGASLDPQNPKRLVATSGKGVIVNETGRLRNLVTKQTFGDVEAHIEFLIPKGSNSGVKFEGLYEIQIFDSYGVKTPTANDCGGIYPRAELMPKYHHIDKGTPPKSNAAKPAGEWQTLDVVFQAPRFDAEGKKIANARFVKVTLNGQIIHDNVEMLYPTGHAWHDKEIATGPLLLQADHGPVAFRNVRVRPLTPAAKKEP
jgi:hypothetical protein